MDRSRPNKASVEGMWDSFVQACCEEAQWKQPSKDLTVESVLVEIDPPKDMEPVRRTQVRDIFRACLQQIDRFGSVVACATSCVFPASQQCFNAISIVTKSVEGIYQMYDNLTIIMERMKAFLQQLRVYVDDKIKKAEAGLSVRETIFEVLTHFLTVLKKAHKLRTRTGAKVLASLKMLAFMNDSGIKSDLDKLELLVSRFVDMEISQIVQGVSYNAQQLDAVGKQLAYASGQIDLVATYTTRTQRLDKIRQILGIGDTSSLSNTLTSGKSAAAVDRSGRWLLKHRLYKDWSDASRQSTSLWALKGQAGTGKSFALDIALRDLRKRYKPDEARENQQSIVCYSAGNDVLDRMRLGRCLKDIIWQLARSNPAYAKFVFDLCEAGADLDDVRTVWQECFAKLNQRLRTIAFVIIDGVEDVSPDCLEQLFDTLSYLLKSENDRRTFRALEPFRLYLIHAAILGGSNLLELQDIDLNRATWHDRSDYLLINQKDLDMSIYSKTCDLFTGSKCIDIANSLKDIASENFALIHEYLDHFLEECITTDDADQALLDLDDFHAQRVSNTVTHLSSKLRPTEIKELNHILAWVVGARVDLKPLSYQLLEGARMLKTDGKLIGSLRNRIQHRYCPLLDVILDGPDGVWVRLQPQVASYFSKLSQSTTETVAQAKLLPSHQSFPNANIGFEPGLSNTDIALDCLRAICDYPEDPAYTPLRQYAFEHLMQHINAIPTDMDGSEVPTITRIFRYMMRWYHEPASIDAFWTEERIAERGTFQWFLGGEEEFLDVLYGDRPNARNWTEWADLPWLANKQLASLCMQQSTEAPAFVEALQADRNPVIVMGAVMRRLSERWLRTGFVPTMSHEYVFNWLAEYADHFRPTTNEDWRASKSSIRARMRAGDVSVEAYRFDDALLLLEPVVFEESRLASEDHNFRQAYVDNICRNVCRSYTKLERYEDGERAMRHIWEACLGFFDCDFPLVNILHDLMTFLRKLNREDEISALLAKLAESGPVDGRGVDRLTTILRGSNDANDESEQVQEDLRLAFGEKGLGSQVDTLEEAYKQAIKICVREKSTGISEGSSDRLPQEMQRKAAYLRQGTKESIRMNAHQHELSLRLYFALLLNSLGENETALSELQRLLASAQTLEPQRRQGRRSPTESTLYSAKQVLTQTIMSVSRAKKFREQSALNERASMLRHFDLPQAAARLYSSSGKYSIAKDMIRPLLGEAVSEIEKQPTRSGLLHLVQRLMLTEADEDAIAAWSFFIAMRAQPYEKQVYYDVAETRQSGLSCCTGCTRQFGREAIGFACRDCWSQDVAFCESCYASLPALSNSRDVMACAKDHQFLGLSLRDSESSDELLPTVAEDGITPLVPGLPTFEIWLSDLRSNWKLDEIIEVRTSRRNVSRDSDSDGRSRSSLRGESTGLEPNVHF